jgi:ATP/maltotriose-dependent transcriptional regulator MalT
MLTVLLNEIATIPDNSVLILDDYHVIEAKPTDKALTFLLEHLPPKMHLVITTREDPALPLARYRVRNQLTELRAADLRFSPAEAATFLNQVMGLDLSAEEVASLEDRTEGWIAGLQLAALSMQGRDPSRLPGFIKAGAAGPLQGYPARHLAWLGQGAPGRAGPGQTSTQRGVCLDVTGQRSARGRRGPPAGRRTVAGHHRGYG